MTEKVTKSVRLPENYAQKVEEYADSEGISESDALRQVIQRQFDRSETESHFEAAKLVIVAAVGAVMGQYAGQPDSMVVTALLAFLVVLGSLQLISELQQWLP